MAIKLINNFTQKQQEIKAAIANTAAEVGAVVVADLQANSPVKHGLLRRGHNFKLKKSGNSNILSIGNYMYYAPYVEFKPVGRGGNPWFRKTLRADAPKIKKMCEEGLRRVK